MSDRVLTADLVIRAEDKTGQAFLAVAKKMQQIQRLDKMMNQVDGWKAKERQIVASSAALDRLTSHMQRLESIERTMAATRPFERLSGDIDRATRSANNLERSLGQSHKVAGTLSDRLSHIGMIAGPAVLAGSKHTIEAGITLASRKASLRARGASAADLEHASSDFRDFSKSYTGITEDDYLAGYQDARVISPASEHNPNAPFTMARLGAVYRAGLRNSGLSIEEHDIGDAMRVMDEIGLHSDEQRRDFIDNLLKTQQTFGDQVPIHTLLAAYRNAKQSIYAMSPEFQNRYLPTILQAAGQNGGTEIMTAYNNYIGQHMSHAELVALARKGFIKPSDLEYDKTGKVKSIKAGAKFFEEDLFKSNIAEWSWKFHDNYMSHKGATEKGFDKLVASMPRNMAALIAFLVHNEERLKRDADTRDKATGISAASDDVLAKNPAAGLSALRDAIEQFAATASSPLMDRASSGLKYLASKIQNWSNTYSEFSKDHPQAATWLSGAGLAAGTWYGVSKVWGIASSLFSGGAAGAGGAAAGEAAAARGAASRGLMGGKLGFLARLFAAWQVGSGAAEFDKMVKADPSKNTFGNFLGAIAAPMVKDAVGLMPDDARRRMADAIDADIRRKALDRYDDHRASIQSGRDEFARPEPPPRARGLYDEIMSEQAHQRMLDRKDADLLPQITSALSGHAEITVKVEASSDLVAKVANVVKSQMSAFTVDGVGSTGKSSPDLASQARSMHVR